MIGIFVFLLDILLFFHLTLAKSEKEDKSLHLPTSDCVFHNASPAIFCRHTDSLYVQEWLSKNFSVNPKSISEISLRLCDISVLPNMFSIINKNLDRISVANSKLETILRNTFNQVQDGLRYLDLSGNKLQRIPRAIENITTLEWLNLADNDIGFLPEGPSMFKLYNLRYLNLAWNRLSMIEDIQTGLVNSSRGAMHLGVFNLEPLRSSLEYLNLRGNGIRSFPEQFKRPFDKLQHLDLSFNKISSKYTLHFILGL